MNAAEVLELVRAEAKRALDVDPELLSLTTTFAELSLDSMALVELLVPLEEKLEIEVPQQGLDHVRTVGDFVELIVAHA